MFMKNHGSCEDMGPSAFPVEEVHKIALLDLRMANADRHAGNILVSKDENGKTLLIPIDHGYCLPDRVYLFKARHDVVSAATKIAVELLHDELALVVFEDCTFEWLSWPQARVPFSPDTVEYIKSLDAEKDHALLFYGWENTSGMCSHSSHLSTMLLKKVVERGLPFAKFSNIMCRRNTKQGICD
ncbi:hypothetical protein Leryth_007144 [Lithospermum erythrorhizon]|nr:hypothetical protein Leryth_007144 [Lithospermum erythrorhizon]